MQSSGKLLIDALLVVGFGVQHSGLATLRVKRLVKAKTGIEALAWRSVESLSNVVYILVAAALWQHTGDVVWELTGASMVIMYALAVASWLWYWQLHLFEYDCGLAFGSTTLVSQAAGAQGPKLINWKVGSRRWIRFPVHTAFFGMFFCLPVMTTDLLVLAVVLNVYNVIGSILYDKRIIATAGDAARPYINLTGLIFPPVYRNPRAPATWRWPPRCTGASRPCTCPDSWWAWHSVSCTTSSSVRAPSPRRTCCRPAAPVSWAPSSPVCCWAPS
ncbi:hypothetical protein GCM10020295_16050 [Streptomyces cinereospinus]